MADGIKTSGEAAAAALIAADLVRIVQSSANAKATIQQFKDFVCDGQLPFPAAQNASADANTLDDYEEGTFTPGIDFNGASVGITYSTQTGFYTKIGNIVLFQIAISLSNKGSSVGAAAINGLPFTAAGPGGRVAVAQHELIDLDVAGGRYSLDVAISGTSLVIIEHGDNVVDANISNVDFANTSEITVRGHYRVSQALNVREDTKMLTRTIIEKIEIEPQTGNVGLRMLKQVLTDEGLVLSSQYHRTTIAPKSDPTVHMSSVNGHLVALGFPAVKSEDHVVLNTALASVADLRAAKAQEAEAAEAPK